MAPTAEWKSLATVLITLLSAQSARCEFTTPKNNVQDNTQSWTTGDVLPIAWNSGWREGLDKQPDMVDLWVTWWPRGGYAEKLKANISTKDAGNYNWTINVPNEKIKGEDSEISYVLRLLNHTESDSYPPTPEMLPSKGFILQPSQKAVSSPAASSTPASSASSSSTPNPTSAPSGSPNAASSASTSAEAEPGKHSNTAAIAGGVLGSLVGIALILVGALALLKRKRAGDAREGPPHLDAYNGQAKPVPGAMVYAYHAEMAQPAPPTELHATSANPVAHKAPSVREVQRYEVDGSEPMNPRSFVKN